MQALLLPVGADWYALDIHSVREVVARPAATAVPTAPKPLLGLFNLRGEIVPLFETATLVGLPSLPLGPYVAIVQTAMGPAGLSLSQVPESVELDVSVPSETATFALGARLATLIDADQLLGPGAG